MKNKLYLSWKWVDDQINIVGDKLEGVDLEFVAGIPRGGLIPAVMMSHAFGIKYISYSSAKMLPEELRRKTIVLDDISDTGVTMAEAVKLKFITASLCIRSGTKTVPTYCGTTIIDDDWLVFPWEKLDSVPMQDYLTSNE